MDTTTSRDTKLTEKLNDWARGDEAAAHELFARPDLQAELLKIAHAILARRGDVGGRVSPLELLTDLFVKLNVSFKNRPDRSFENRARFYAYAMRAVESALLTHARKYRRELRRGIHVGVEALDRKESNLAWLSACDPVDLLRVAQKLDELDPKAAFALRRRIFYEATYQEIAEEAGVNLITARRRVARGLAALRDALLGPVPPAALPGRRR